MGFLRSITATIRGVFGEKSRLPGADRARLAEFENSIGYRIESEDLFREALSHRSYMQTSGGAGCVSNERLEFLGDAVLNLLVAESLFGTHAQAPEGELTKIRARLVNRKALTLYARNLDLEKFLLMSPQTDQVSVRGMETILADAYEAVVGAVYLDGGYDQARSFIRRTVLEPFRRGEVGSLDDNYKSMLLEYAQAEGMGVPRYSTLNEEGPDHDRTFTVVVQIGNNARGTGAGKNKKDAEQSAACAALKSLQVIS